MAEDDGAAPVQCYVYDLSGGMARTWAPLLIGRPLEGIWHTSIVLRGRELYFGGGINVAAAGSTLFGHPVQVIDLGTTCLPDDIVDAMLAELSERYTPQAYRLLDNNCNNFSDEVSHLLCGRGIPEHITGLPAEVMSTPFGQMIRPLLTGLEQQLSAMRGQAFQPAAAAPAAVPSAVPALAAPEVAAPPVTRLAADAMAEGAPALAAAEVEIEAAIAGGMVQEAEQALHAEEQPPAAAVVEEAVAAKAREEELGTEESKLAAELAVRAAFERLTSADQALSEHDALAQALEAVSPAQPGQPPSVVASAEPSQAAGAEKERQE